MKKMVLICMVMIALLLCSCGSADYFVAAPVPPVGTVVVASTPTTSTVGVVATPVYPRTYVTYPYGYSSGYYYYSAPTYRRLPPPPPPRKRARRH